LQPLVLQTLGFWPLQLLSHHSDRQPKTYVNPEAAITVFELLMVGGVLPETCSAIKKPWNNKFYYTVASCMRFMKPGLRYVPYYSIKLKLNKIWKLILTKYLKQLGMLLLRKRQRTIKLLVNVELR
jgi:hypothetical protein